MYYDTHTRSILKTISWRILATLTTTLIVFLLTGRINIALMVGGLEAVSKIVLYFFHERTWNKVKFGKKEVKPFVLWFTGLPYSGKTTVADEVYEVLKKNELRVERLDSRNIRDIFKDLGFSKEEVDFHIKRVGHLASMLEKNGIIVIASFVSPYRESRDFVRGLSGNFIEVYTKAPMDVTRERHRKKSEKKVLEGKKEVFPEEVFQMYEEPVNSDITIDTGKEDINSARDKVLKFIGKRYLR